MQRRSASNTPGYEEAVGSSSSTNSRRTSNSTPHRTLQSATGQSNADGPPPAYISTVYDETFRAVWQMDPSIMSMANSPNLLGHLEFPSALSDGSFSICIAGGNGTFVSKALLESIPEAHRPALDQSDAGTQVKTMFGSMKAIGSVMFPFLLTHGDTGERMRYVLRALILPDLYIPMFISGPDDGVVERMQFGGRADRRPVFTLKCRDTVCPVLGIPFH